jgi:hypothetical protein
MAGNMDNTMQVTMVCVVRYAKALYRGFWTVIAAALGLLNSVLRARGAK